MLQNKLADKLGELASLPALIPDFHVTESQLNEQLGLKWYKDQLNDEISSIQNQIKCLTRTATRSTFNPRLVL